jgi:hypothetical protein
MSLYNLKALPDKFLITKFTKDLEVGNTYQLSGGVCTCPAGVHNRYCRHREMKELFEEQGRVNSCWFLEYETRKWWWFNHDKGTLTEEIPWRRL